MGASFLWSPLSSCLTWDRTQRHTPFKERMFHDSGCRHESSYPNTSLPVDTAHTHARTDTRAHTHTHGHTRAHTRTQLPATPLPRHQEWRSGEPSSSSQWGAHTPLHKWSSQIQEDTVWPSTDNVLFYHFKFLSLFVFYQGHCMVAQKPILITYYKVYSGAGRGGGAFENRSSVFSCYPSPAQTSLRCP